jgi:cell division GTPase FtsZ
MSKKPVKKTKKATLKAGTTDKSTKEAVQKPEKVETRSSKPVTAESLVPVLDLEHYEPRIQQETGIQDQNKGSTRYAWIGAGQCGGRLVKSFYDLGYRKVLAINTTRNDLDMLNIPQSHKFLMDTGERGAGKDMRRGEKAVQQNQQEILHLARKTFGTDVDHIMVCFGAGGGTGSGSVGGLIEIAKRYARYIGLENPHKKVGVIMTLPTVGEASSPLVAENAYKVATTLSQMAMSSEISPLIIIDNEKIKKMYPGLTVKSFWPSINSTVSSLFDIFNRLSSLNSRYTSFDAMDYRSIMQSGGCSIMGLTKVQAFDDPYALSEAMKENLAKTLLAGGFDLSTANMAGCIVVGGKKLMAHTKGLQNNIDYAFDVLSEITGRATIHRGIYEDDRDSLRVYTIIGGLNSSNSRLEEISSCITVSAH